PGSVMSSAGKTSSSAPAPAPFDAVLFDLDGTLLDTVPDLAAAGNRMLAVLGKSEVSEEVVASFVGLGVKVLVERLLAASGCDATMQTEAQALYEEYYAQESGRRSCPYPGVTDALAALARAGMPMGVITNKPAAFTLPLLAGAELAPYFDIV